MAEQMADQTAEHTEGAVRGGTTGRRRGPRLVAVVAAAAMAFTVSTIVPGPVEAANPLVARVATFNASLNRSAPGELITDLSTSDDAQAGAVAEIIQRTRPDILVINEFDFDDADGGDSLAARLFQDNYLSVPQRGAEPITYRYRMAFPSNTGVASGFDLNNNGTIVTTPGTPGYGDDALGFGNFEGQFAFAVFSVHPIDESNIRTFRNFLWKDMPGALLPQQADGTPWYSDEELAVLPLSSKSHVDVPVRVRGRTVHLLISHPTPPVFDGPEDRNGRRNHDEIRFWADYIGNTRGRSAYIYDDNGGRGGLPRGRRFVIAGDLNSDPFDGDSIPGSAQLVLDHWAVDATNPPASTGGPERAAAQGLQNDTHRGDPAFDTADFGEGSFGPGNLRVDYVLPSKAGLTIRRSGVFWPALGEDGFDLTGVGFPPVSSDHRLVWVDLRVH